VPCCDEQRRWKKARELRLRRFTSQFIPTDLPCGNTSREKKKMDGCHQLATGWIKPRRRLLVKKEKERNGGTVGFGEFIAVGGSISYML